MKMTTGTMMAKGTMTMTMMVEITAIMGTMAEATMVTARTITTAMSNINVR